MVKILQLYFVVSFLVFSNGCSLFSDSKKDPKTSKAEVLYNYGTAALVKKNYTDALSKLLQAVKLDPNNPKIHNNLGMAYYFKKSHKQAAQHFKKALELDSKHADARNNLASLYFEKRQYNLAKKEYEKILKLLTYPKQFRTYYNMALIENINNNRELAKDYLKKSIADNNSYCPAYFFMGRLFASEKNYEKALYNFNESGKGKCYNDPAPTYYQGLTLLELNKTSQAKAKFQDLIKRMPGTQFAKLAQKQINKIIKKEYRKNKAIVRNNDLIHHRKKDAEKDIQAFNTPNF